jgi:murein DD-endopeptidase MepM/ murein hydrolase activator NlpD
MEDAASVAGEDAFIDASMSGFNPERRWADGPFPLPAAGVMASAFGTIRAYNSDVYDRYHTGADLGGPAGTPIYAPADGVVVDAGLLDVRGYMTILDHGWGVYTGYWHQSSILVEPGESVTRGQQIGTIGNTGLSTAAHLHWEMRINGVKVDPMQWVREAFP